MNQGDTTTQARHRVELLAERCRALDDALTSVELLVVIGAGRDSSATRKRLRIVQLTVAKKTADARNAYLAALDALAQGRLEETRCDAAAENRRWK